MMTKIPMTRNGYDALVSALTERLARRSALLVAIEDSNPRGDLTENGEYQVARQNHDANEMKIRELESKISRADIIDSSSYDDDIVRFGAAVTVNDDDDGADREYRIVGEGESDIKHGKISISSPIGKALVGHRVGDVIDVFLPNKIVKSYEIMKVQYG